MRRIVALLPGALLFALVAAPAAAGGGGCHEPLTDAADTSISMTSDNCFGPTIARVEVGDTVSFVNDSPQQHTVTGANMAFGSTDIVATAADAKFTFDTAGIYPYFCILHAGMAGAIVVGDSAAAAAPLPDSPVPDAAGPGPVPLESAPDDDGPTAPLLVLGGAVGLVVGGGLALIVRRRPTPR